jgi:hypothetical protein
MILLPIKRPCVDVWACVAVLGVTSEHVVYELVDEGGLTALNIGTEGKRCLRVTTRSLIDYVNGAPKAQTPEQVLADLFPGHAETVLGTNVARALNTKREIVAAWVKHGTLESAGRAGRACRGATSTQRITRQSLAAFVRGRLQ